MTEQANDRATAPRTSEKVSIRLSNKVIRRLRLRAKREMRTMHWLIVYIVTKAVEEEAS